MAISPLPRWTTRRLDGDAFITKSKMPEDAVDAGGLLDVGHEPEAFSTRAASDGQLCPVPMCIAGTLALRVCRTRVAPRSTAAPVVFFVLTLAASAAVVGALFLFDQPPAPLPGVSFQGSASPLDADAIALREGLSADVDSLAVQIGERNTRRPRALIAAVDHLEARLASLGLVVTRQTYEADGVACHNLVVDLPHRGARRDQLLLGAHYDSVRGSPGANDNASGVAVLLGLVERLSRRPPSRPMRVLFFVNEEPPYFRTSQMGSRAYAAQAASRNELPAQVVVLDSVGFYSGAPGSQRFPLPSLTRRFGDRGDFVAFVSDRSSEPLLLDLVGAFRAHAELPSKGGAFSDSIAGVAWSDHASFWRYDVSAVLVSDTATFRDANYHEPTDRGEQIDFDALTRLSLGLEAALREL